MFAKLKILAIFLLGLALSSCGKKVSYQETFYLLSSQQNLAFGPVEAQNYQEQKALFEESASEGATYRKVDKASLSHYLDLDNDGTPDAFDEDIDGDGVHNLLDSHPFDATRGGEDSDGDGIPDLVDFNSPKNKKFAKLASLQERIWKSRRIVIAAQESWSLADAQVVFKKFEQRHHQNLLEQTSSLKVVHFAEQDKLRRAEFEPNWKTIALFPSELRDSPWEISASFSHELFHVLAIDRPNLYLEFLDLSPWSVAQDEYGMNLYVFSSAARGELEFSFEELRFNYEQNKTLLGAEITPSIYSLQGPEEHFADAGLATMMRLEGRANYSMERFTNLNLYYHGELDRLFEEVLASPLRF